MVCVPREKKKKKHCTDSISLLNAYSFRVLIFFPGSPLRRRLSSSKQTHDAFPPFPTAFSFVTRNMVLVENKRKELQDALLMYRALFLLLKNFTIDVTLSAADHAYTTPFSVT
jgi:hypothetical protein